MANFVPYNGFSKVILQYAEGFYKMECISAAKEIGFEGVCRLNTESLHPLQEVREMCAADRCGAYGKCWSCPPACGSIEHCTKRLAEYSDGILVQTVGTLADEYDLDGIRTARLLHDRRFRTLVRQIRFSQPDCLPLSAGNCMLCLACTYPARPCRFPKKMLSSMEAYGLLVKEVCERSGLPYYHGKGTISFTSCVLYHHNYIGNSLDRPGKAK